jgi:hypothetical protein
MSDWCGAHYNACASIPGTNDACPAEVFRGIVSAFNSDLAQVQTGWRRAGALHRDEGSQAALGALRPLPN